MKILVVGATGRTGLHVLREGAGRGHTMVAFTRRPAALADAGVVPAEVVHGDGLDPEALRRAVHGCDAVISIVAPEHLGPSTVQSDVVRNLVRAMETAGVNRLVMTSSRSITATRPRFALAVVWTVFRNAYIDLVRAETIVRESALDWTIARATMLRDGNPKGRVHVDFEANAMGGTSTLDRADYALALVDAVEDPSLARRAFGVAGPDRRALAAASSASDPQSPS